MSDKYGNPDRVVLVERIYEWMEELEKAGRFTNMWYPPNNMSPAFARIEIEKLIFEDAFEL